MSAQASSSAAVPLDTLVVIKISVNGSLKKLKLPLRDLNPNVLFDKLRLLLSIEPEKPVLFERFSDSAGRYVLLDSTNAQVFKTLMRAAKAKLKLRLKASVLPTPAPPPALEHEEVATEEPSHTSPSPRDSTSASTLAPIIVHSPSFRAVARESTALDNRSIGSGIFEFREARASKTDLSETALSALSQASPIPSSEPKSATADIAIRTRPVAPTEAARGCAWSVYCNECDSAMADAHYHCNICDRGDYDLCESCVAAGRLCPGEDHWLIKRFIKDGKMINSFTERISPHPKKEIEVDDVKPIKNESSDTTEPMSLGPLRTCNSCVVIRAEHEFVTCKACGDFDLCIPCHSGNKHGHHPAHAFRPATTKTELSTQEENLLAAGRNVRHNAICDGCDKKIFGVRHKCLGCPDWDYCQECIVNARQTHPRHRFAPLYEPIPNGASTSARHTGVYCDGPLCSRRHGPQAYITGARYKCAVCNDVDFCASCEAVPSNTHNRTHPLIMFKTPVSGVSISTINESASGSVRTLGDRAAVATYETRTAGTETTPMMNINAATQVQTMAEIKPTTSAGESVAKATIADSSPPFAAVLAATFVRDTVVDGTTMGPGSRFTQVWTMRNTGAQAWPAGCSVHFVGGDNMLDVDHEHPLTIADINNAKESNVVGRGVQAGEEVAFKISLRAPKREGTAISYWRLKTAAGTPFGHRLWCDIAVKAAMLPPPPPPPPMPPAPLNPVLTSKPDIQQQHLAWAQERIAMRQRLMAIHQHNLQRHAKAAAGVPQNSMCPPLQQHYAHYPHAAVNMVPHAMPAPQQTEVKAATGAPYEAYSQPWQGFSLPKPQLNMPPGLGQHLDWSNSEAARARKEAAKSRVEHIRAKILRAREDKVEAMNVARQVNKKPVEEVAASAVEAEPVIEEAPVEASHAEDVQGSQMVFPTLEKESPSSSTYQSFTSSSKGKAAYVENEQGDIERSASPTVETVMAITTPACMLDFDAEDLEILSAAGELSEEDGFHTDEEYDILDASDRETVASP